MATCSTMLKETFLLAALFSQLFACSSFSSVSKNMSRSLKTLFERWSLVDRAFDEAKMEAKERIGS